MQRKEDRMEEELLRIGNSDFGVWCRSTAHTSYDNVYAVAIGAHGDECHVRAHKVIGSLAEGNLFAGFLVASLNVEGAATTLPHVYRECQEDLPRFRTWVVVVAGSAEDAILHRDVAEVRSDILNPHPESFCGVYFASNGNGCVKVGQTTYPLRTRIAQIQAGSPHRLYVCATITTGDRKAIEKEIHKSIAGQRLHGEWFNLTDDEAIALARQYGGREVQGGSKKATPLSPC
jgi:hypothetical protein